jgi:hypothetical protein
MPHIYPYAKTQHTAVFRCLFVFVTLFSSHLLIAQPIVNSFSPTAGPVGTAVTITGSNFSTTSTNNIVFFGAVKAAVTASTSTSLTVTVPSGATFQPITVTTAGLTGYAKRAFNVTFNPVVPVAPSSYNKITLATATGVGNIGLADLDGDGKPDLVVDSDAGYFSVYRNNSTPGNVSFSRKDFTNNGITALGLGDIDGDGKPDVLITRASADVKVFRNTSTPGNISFAPVVNITAGVGLWQVAINDIDGDGKSDIAVADKISPGAIRVLRNTSTPGTISFASPLSFAAEISPDYVVLEDIDGDRKPEIIANGPFSNSMSVLRNTSTPGNISFLARENFATAGMTVGIATGDLDSDGITDIVTGIMSPNNTINAFINYSNSTYLGLSKLDFGTVDGPWLPSINDIDGDGKPDVLVSNFSAANFAVLQNQSRNGRVYLYSSEFATESRTDQPQSGDIDGDGKADLIVANIDASKLSIFVSKSLPTLTGFTPLSGGAGSTVTISGTNLHLATALTIGGVPVTSYNIVSPNTITAIVPAGSKGTITVTTATGTASLDGFGLAPAITSFSPATGPIGTTVTITGSNFSTTASDNIVYLGSVKANVLSASATTLTVKVPIGSLYQPISVTTNKLTAYTTVPFNITFPTIGASFAANSFATGVNFKAGSGTYDAATGDFDGDGKNDVVTANYFDKTISVFRNTSINGSVRFAAKVDYDVDRPEELAIGDLDGDGKLEIILGDGPLIKVYKNNCTPGTITFTQAGEFEMNYGITEILVSDLDDDGRSDLVMSDGSGVTLLKNTSAGSTISFAAFVHYEAGYLPGQIAVNDLDGDGKKDLVITSTDNATVHNGKISIFRNTTIPGAPFSSTSLAPNIDIAMAKGTVGVQVVDMDGDGKPEIIAGNSEARTLYVLKNLSTPGNISMATRISFNTGRPSGFLSINDMDGDGKPDLFIPYDFTRVGLMKNTSTPGTPSFAPVVIYSNSSEPQTSVLGDLDGDGKPDAIVANYTGDGFTVYRNQVAEATVVPSGTSPVTGNIVNKLAIETTVPLNGNTPYVQRHYDVLPDNNAATATGTVTLYFTQQEFDNFNATANHGANLPTDPSDANGIANLRIYQYQGTSTTGLPGSYSGSAVAIDPDDANIVWDFSTQWWAVTFTVNGFSGFFASNASFNYLQPAAPVITANGNTIFCTGGSVTLSSSASAGNQWYKNGQAISNANNITLVVNAGGTYSVTSTSNGMVSALSNGIVVTVTSVPAKPTITRNGSQLVSSAPSGNQWYKDGVAINSATGNSITPTDAGNYSVKVSSNGCTSDESDKFNYTITGVVDLDNNHFIKLSPNPVTDKVRLEFDVAGSYNLTIQLIDMYGKICKTFTNQTSGSQLSFAGLNSGVYIANIFISNQKQHYTIRLIKQ